MNIRQWTKKLMTGVDYDMSALEIPALIIADGNLSDYSPAALPIVEAFNNGMAELKYFIDQIDDLKPFAEDRIVVSQFPLQIYWFTGSKIDDRRIVLIARDVSNDEKLLQAFVSSRELYGDLIRCAADFGWELDETGSIIYIGPDKGLGWSGPDVAGEDAWHLFCPEEQASNQVNPFVAKERQEHRNVAMTDRSGESRRMTIISMPKHDDKGRWVGNRGICRDVTDDYQAAVSAKHLSARNAVFSRIIAAMRTEVAAEGLLVATAKAVSEVMRADASWVIRPDRPDSLFIGEGDMREFSHAVVVACHATPEWKNLTEGCRSIKIGSRTMQMLTVVGDEKIDGVIVISRNTEEYVWRDYENQLLQDIFEHLALAIRQAALFETLEKLSTIDELTNLYNRRAFSEMVNKRVAAQRRNNTSGCLLYIDLDNFKEVNDTLGHAAGDEVLRFMGAQLNSLIRAEDLPGRLGGDEFALWLEATGTQGATIKAQQLIELAPKMRLAAGDINLNLGMSIGVAISKPDDQKSFDMLTVEADEALYKAKHAGKGTVVVA